MHWIFLGVFSLLSIIIISIVIFSVYYGISPMPTSQKVLRNLLPLIPKEYKGKIVDLGSGFGSLAKALALHCPQATIIGYEVSVVPLWVSKLFFRRRNLTFVCKNFFKQDLSDAGYIVCYLFPGAMDQLEKQFARQSHDTIVISHTFALPSKRATHHFFCTDLYKTPVYRYDYRTRFLNLAEEGGGFDFAKAAIKMPASSQAIAQSRVSTNT